MNDVEKRELAERIVGYMEMDVIIDLAVDAVLSDWVKYPEQLKQDIRDFMEE